MSNIRKRFRINQGRIQMRPRQPPGRTGPKSSVPTKFNEDHVSDSVHLADLDDLVTGLVLDPILGFQTHKMRIGWHSMNWNQSFNSKLRKIVEDFQQVSDNVRIIFKIHSLLQSHGFYFSKRDYNCFNKHLTYYLQLLDTSNGFEIQPCTRYAGDGDHGAKIITTRIRAKGEHLRIFGVYSILTPEEQRKLIGPHNDFAVKSTTRPKSGVTTEMLYLGPAAFVNHSCEPNCEEVMDDPSNSWGRPSSHYRVIRPIDAGEELTLNYGPKYFDKNECRCKACTPGLWMEAKSKKVAGCYNLRNTESRLRRKRKHGSSFR